MTSDSRPAPLDTSFHARRRAARLSDPVNRAEYEAARKDIEERNEAARARDAARSPQQGDR